LLPVDDGSPGLPHAFVEISKHVGIGALDRVSDAAIIGNPRVPINSRDARKYCLCKRCNDPGFGPKLCASTQA
jgi:hypothetical protein